MWWYWQPKSDTLVSFLSTYVKHSLNKCSQRLVLIRNAGPDLSACFCTNLSMRVRSPSRWVLHEERAALRRLHGSGRAHRCAQHPESLGDGAEGTPSPGQPNQQLRVAHGLHPLSLLGKKASSSPLPVGTLKPGQGPCSHISQAPPHRGPAGAPAWAALFAPLLGDSPHGPAPRPQPRAPSRPPPALPSGGAARPAGGARGPAERGPHRPARARGFPEALRLRRPAGPGWANGAAASLPQRPSAHAEPLARSSAGAGDPGTENGLLLAAVTQK